MNKSFTPMTDEQRLQVKQNREAAQQWASENLLDSFADETFWRTLSSDAGIRMPQRHVPGTDIKHMKRACKKLNIEVSDFLQSTGFSTLKQLATNNIKWPSWALVGLILEYENDIKTNPVKYPSNID
jgi:hypothetical protein